MTGILRGHSRIIFMIVGVIAWALFVSTRNENFLTTGTARVVALNMSLVAIAAVGTAILIIGGNIDLSIGALFCLAAIVSAKLSQSAGVPLWLCFLIGILAAGAVAAVNGILCWSVPVSPIVITLGSMILIRGAISVWTDNSPINTTLEFSSFARSDPLGIPMPVWVMLIVVITAAIIMSTTKVGRHIYAIGGNREACEAAGIRVRRLVIGSFVASGLLVGLAGILAAGRFGTPDSTYGNGWELIVITGVLLGGVSFSGGEGSVVGAVLGVLVLTILDSGIVALGINPYWSQVVQGLILILVVVGHQVVHGQQSRFQRRLAVREQEALEAKVSISK